MISELLLLDEPNLARAKNALQMQPDNMVAAVRSSAAFPAVE